MRRSVVRRLLVLLILVFTVLPASAAPRRDDPFHDFIHRVFDLIKKVIPLEDAAPVNPKP